MDKFIFNKVVHKGGTDFEMKIKTGNPSVQDFLDDMNGFIENSDLPRLWPPASSKCYGCDLCCHEPLPVTSIDVENICKALHIGFIESFKYLWIEVQGNVVDITLKRKNGQNCIFLNKEGTCTIYNARPFLCQTYICCNVPDSLNEIRSQIVNQGMDELVRKAIIAFNSQGNAIPVNRGSTRNINLADWPRNRFTDKNMYTKIYLKDILSSDLLRVLLL